MNNLINILRRITNEIEQDKSLDVHELRIIINKKNVNMQNCTYQFVPVYDENGNIKYYEWRCI